MPTTPNSSDLARVLGDLAVEMENQLDAESVLQTITAGAVAIIPGVRWAGISRIRGRTVEARVPSDPSMRSSPNSTKALASLRCVNTTPCTSTTCHNTLNCPGSPRQP